MSQAAVTHATKSSVAKILHISRRSVQRYCDLYDQILLRSPKLPPMTDSKGKVNVGLLFEFIQARKRHDGRGYPLGQKRLGIQTRLERVDGENGKSCWIRMPRGRSKTFGRTFEKRLEVIKNEIDAMTDYEQSVLIKNSPAFFLEMFRPEAVHIAENYKKLRASWERGERPPIKEIPRRPRS